MLLYYDDSEQDDPIQDDEREKQLIELFDLTKFVGKDRNADGNPDAIDELQHPYELKSTTRDAVSTARDFGRNHLKRYLTRYWIVGKGRNRRTGFVFDRIFFLAPVHLHEWAAKLSARFDEFDAIGAIMMDAVDDSKRRIASQIVSRGSTLNDPGMRWNYVKANGVEIYDNHATVLRQLVDNFPIVSYKPSLVASHLILFGITDAAHSFNLHPELSYHR